MSSMSLKEVLNGYYRFSERALAMLEELAVKETYRKGEFITKKGKYDSKEYLVLDGICRTCIYGPNGEDSTLSFFVQGSVLSPHVIRVDKEFSILNVQASTDLELINFDAKSFEQLMIDNVEVREFGNEVLKRELASMFQKDIGLASLTAKERLIKFRKDFSMLENLIPHSEIASYLGITTISLSRLRKELMH
jgi:CRP-like cAMP-binding protein